LHFHVLLGCRESSDGDTAPFEALGQVPKRDPKRDLLCVDFVPSPLYPLALSAQNMSSGCGLMSVNDDSISMEQYTHQNWPPIARGGVTRCVNQRAEEIKLTTNRKHMCFCHWDFPLDMTVSIGKVENILVNTHWIPPVCVCVSACAHKFVCKAAAQYRQWGACLISQNEITTIK
jgi:hypothetical protein